MAYVPGFEYDVFVSYAHGDKKDWIRGFTQRLESALIDELGDSADVWVDDSDLRPTRDFRKEIPDSVTRTAIFLFLPSPAYLRSQYCVEVECRAFEETMDSRRARFTGQDFANEQYALRCPIGQVDNDEHHQLFPGLDDIWFCDANGIFPIGKTKFERSFTELIQKLVPLLKRMRNHCTPVFVYPRNPDLDLKEAQKSLADELTDMSYRVLPDRFTNLPGQLHEASVAVFLVGENWDKGMEELAALANQTGKKWVVWFSPTAKATKVPEQLAVLNILEKKLDSPTKTFLSGTITELKLEVRSLLNPDPWAAAKVGSKRQIYLLYKQADPVERLNAGLIAKSFYKEFHFDHPDETARHKFLLTHSAGVLLLWGNAEENWCASQFKEVALSAKAKGLCVFDPEETKRGALQQIRAGVGDVCIAEQFGQFERSRLDQFFNLVRQSA